jgi:Glyoxalase/Bleomycin resistance protein/Dioxygenase superfamily
MKSVLNHIALLVPNAVKSAEYLSQFDFKIGPHEKWDGEGTLEIYIGDLNSLMANLLLMEPIAEGAYSRALAKRGPGLHHIAIDVLNLEAYIDQLSGSGWLLHPRSLKMIKHSQTAYLARPDVPTLIEVQQRDVLKNSPQFISEIMIPNLTTQHLKMFSSLGINQIQCSKGNDLIIKAHNKELSFKDLCL